VRYNISELSLRALPIFILIERYLMPRNIAIIGAQVGDEAKGKITHDWSDQFAYICRFAGGSNVGAQVYRNGKSYIHHQLPAVDYTRSKAKSFLASGMVVNLPYLLEELLTMQKDFPNVGKSVIIDPDAFVVLPEHIEEDKKTGGKQGTTYQGIKQAYRSKVDRTGTRIYNLIRDNADIIKALQEHGVRFFPILKLREELEHSSILFEGNQGVMLDLNVGLYPYITSADCTISGIYSAGFNFIKLDTVYGVAKGGYITRSGGQKLPTEMNEADSKRFVEKGHEYGNTTSRARGIGYLDCIALKYACKKAGITDLILTKLDIMDGEKTIKACISYGKEVYSPGDFYDLKPEYIDLPGWDKSEYPTLNANLRNFVKFIEKSVDTPVRYISNGVEPKNFHEFV
jgi:adenylosuccinate synthase